MCASVRTPYDMPISTSHANMYVVASSDHTKPGVETVAQTTCRNVSSVMNASADDHERLFEAVRCLQHALH